MILSVSSLRKSFAGEDLLKDITFKIEDHDKIAVIGVNGAGKSTLLKIITKEESYDEGTITYRKDIKIGYLSQHSTINSRLSIYDALLEVFQPLIEKEQRLRQLEQLMATNSNLDAILREYDQLSFEFENEGGYSYTSQIKGVLKGLGFEENEWNQPVSILSGGQKTRLALGRLLLTQPDLLLLDEPTNHLDVNAIEWLESYLKNYASAILVVSHDRYFIDQVTSTIIDIENGRSTTYKCHYNEYALIKKHNRDIEYKHYVNNQKEIKRMQESIDLLRSFNREKQIKRAQSKEKALEKMEKVDKPEILDDTMKIQFQPLLESGYDVLSVRDLGMAFEKPLFEHISFEVKRQERVALIGPNGIGKTTLFRIILQDLKPTKGKFIIGSKVMMGYYDQEQTSLSSNKTIFEEISDAYPRMNNTEIRNAAAAFLFKGDDVFKTMDMLSGGEKGRVVLMKLLLSKANFLLLDEPTNHLDIVSKEILEDALLSFSGTILFISHDRYFINKIATKVVAMDSQGCTTYIGNYDDYLNHRSLTNTTAAKDKNTDYLEKKKQQSLERKHQNEIKKIEDKITKLENEINEINELLLQDDVINDYMKYNELNSKLTQKEKELDEKMDEWEKIQ